MSIVVAHCRGAGGVMFRVCPNGENRIDIEFSGQVGGAEMAQALDELVAASANLEHGVMLYRIGDFQLPTLGAFAIELARLPDLLRLTARFDRIAVVCTDKWIQNASEIEGALIPGLSIKAFTPDDVEQAERWLSE